MLEMKSSRSPFKKFSHSREGSTEEKPSSFHKRSVSGSGTGGKHARNVSGSGMGNAPPVSGVNASHRRTTSNSSRSSQSSNFLAEQYERDRKAIISSCFTGRDRSSGAVNSYITHVRIIEDSRSPSSRPPPNSQLENKKKRILILSAKPNNSQAIQIHKGRENSDGSIQIGRTWDLKELKRVERDLEVNEGFVLTMGKKYYWETNSAKERTVFVKSLVNTYMQAFDGHVPELVNWDLAAFYLDERSYQRAVITRVSAADPTVGDGKNGQSVAQAGTASPSMDVPLTRDTDASNQTMAKSLHKAPYANSPTIAEASRRHELPQQEKDGFSLGKDEDARLSFVSAEPSIHEKGFNDVLKAATEPEHEVMLSASVSPRKSAHLSQSQENQRDHLLENLNNVLGSPDAGFPRASLDLEGKSPDAAILPREEFLKETTPVTVAKAEPIVEEHLYEPTAFESQDLDLNETISDEAEGNATNELSFETGDEVRYSQVLEPDSAHTYHEVSTIREEATAGNEVISKDKLLPTVEVEDTTVSKSSPVKKKAWDIDDQEILEILTEINWDVDDDTDNIVARLNSRIAETEYHFNTSLISLEKLAPDLQPYEHNVARECDKMNPVISLFLMEMSNVSGDIEYVESQHNGLQVESANKKQLWNTLSELLNTVSLDELSLEELLNCPITERSLLKMEGQLKSLFKALKAINGEEDEEHYNLGKMKALKQRRETYEKVTKVFIERLVNEMIGKFANISKDELSEDHLASFLNRLLRFSSLILFCKDISPESYKYLIEKWTSNISDIYNKMCATVVRRLESLKTSFEVSEKGSINEQPGLANLLSEWKHVRGDRESEENSSFSRELVKNLRDIMETFGRWVIVYQNFINNFFHISLKLDFGDFIQKFSDPESRMIPLLEVRSMHSDRTSATIETQLVSKIFQPIITRISSGFTELLKCDRSIAPALMISLERKVRSLEASSAEFLMSAYSRLLSQVVQVWGEYIDDQVMHLQRLTINVSSRSLLPSAIGLPLFIKNSQDSIKETEAELDIDDDSTFETIQIYEAACSKLSSAVAKLLKRKDDNSTLINHSESTETASPDSKNIDRTITLLMNCHWLLELLNILNSKGTFDETLREAKAMFDIEKDSYASYLLRDSMPKLTSFVHGATNLIANTPPGRPVDPSKWAAYSKHNLDIILAGYTSGEIDTLVKRLHQHMLLHFDNEPDETIKEALCDKMWSCIQGRTVSLYLGLYTLIEKHYKGTYLKFTKNDVITAFESFKKQNF